MADYLLVIRKQGRAGNFADTNKVSMPGDVCLSFPLGVGPGNSPVWKSGRFCYAVVRNISASTAMDLTKPMFWPVLDVDGLKYRMKHKYGRNLSAAVYNTLSTDWENPTEINLAVAIPREKS